MDKPDWAIMVINATMAKRRADKLIDQANDRRCQVEDSGGAQCTADRWPDHEHRHRLEDLP